MQNYKLVKEYNYGFLKYYQRDSCLLVIQTPLKWQFQTSDTSLDLEKEGLD
jgi:hypothetical protein